MNTIFLRTLYFITAWWLIYSCTKPNDTDGISGLTPFEVTVIERRATQAIITWTESTNLSTSNSDTVKYKVVINNRIVATGLINLIDTIDNISIDTTYYGRVIAYTSADTTSAPFVLPKIEEYIAFYGTSNNKFEAYNLYSGIRLWNKSIDLNWFNNNRIGAPTISNDTVFFADTYSHIPNPLLHACNLKTGQVYWTALTGVPLVVATHTNPVYDKGKLFLMTGNGLVCINSATGQTLWTTPIADGKYGMTPVVNNNIVFAVSPQKDLVAVNQNNGTVLWQKAVGSVRHKPLLINGLIVVNTDNQIIAYNQATGALAWQKTSPAGGSVTWNHLVASGNTIVLFIEFSGFYGFNATTGAVTWFKPFDWLSSPDVNYTTGNGLLYCFDSYSTPNKLFAINISSGNIAWENTSVPTAAWELVYANKKLYAIRGTTLSGTHGMINIFDAPTGVWKDAKTLRFSDNMANYTLKLNDSVYYNPLHGNF